MRVGVRHTAYRGMVTGLIAGVLTLSACDADAAGGATYGVPLNQLDLSGSAPIAVTLGGSDNVLVTTGPAFTVRAEGSPAAVDRMRFIREGTGLAIGRQRGAGNSGGTATIHVTLPAVQRLALSGSGSMASDRLSGTAEVMISGSGDVTVRQVDAESLKVALAGSGEFDGSGTAGTLDLTMQGSGTADMKDLRVSRAKVTLSGSGTASFASDGSVDATIAGSGNVRVRGNAQCNQQSAGPGRLTCRP